MRVLNIFLITVTCLASLMGAQGDDDEDDCEFIKSLLAKSKAKDLDFTVKDNYPRDYCALWRLVGPRSEVVRIDVAIINQQVPGTCRNAYLKLEDDETKVTAKVNSWFLMKGPEILIYFRPDRCLQNFRLAYRSSVNHEWTDEDSSGNRDDDDDDEDSGRTGRIIGTVIGCVLAVGLVVLICVLIYKCSRRRKAREPTPGDDISVHFWSKPSVYTAGTAVRPSTSRDNEYDSMSFPGAHKMGQAEAGEYHNNMAQASNYHTATAPVPPPYPGHPTNLATESSHFSKELPPSYSDVVQGK